MGRGLDRNKPTGTMALEFTRSVHGDNRLHGVAPYLLTSILQRVASGVDRAEFVALCTVAALER